jgi:hypothetical protein
MAPSDVQTGSWNGRTSTRLRAAKKMRAPSAMKMPSTAQRSHAGKNAPNISSEGASEQPHRDSSGSATTLARTGRCLIQRSAPRRRPSASNGGPLNEDMTAIFISILCRPAISHDGCDRREDGVRTISGHMSSRLHRHSIDRLSKSAVIVAPSIRANADGHVSWRYVEATHEICPYSNAIKASVDVKITTRS